MKTQLIECSKCGSKNRIAKHGGNLRPKCGRCGTFLVPVKHDQGNSSPRTKKQSTVLISVLLVALAGVGCGITITPTFIEKDFSSLTVEENQKTKLLKDRHIKELSSIKATLETELTSIDPLILRDKADQHYRAILDARRSYDKRFALTPREKVQLRMRNIASDSTKSFHSIVKAVAIEASPRGADINIHETARGIALHIDFDMSSMTSGEHGTRTKHHTKNSLRKETISLISRVTNDIFQFCRRLELNSIHVGCRHYVQTKYPNGSTRDENTILYKIRIKKDHIPQLTSNPFLDVYSTTKYFEIDEDNFDEIEIRTTRT